jgi:hypothetical protein
MSGLVEIIREKLGIEPGITDEEINYITEASTGIPDENCEWWCRWPDGMEQSPNGILLAVLKHTSENDQDPEVRRRLANLTLPYSVAEHAEGRDAIARVKQVEAELETMKNGDAKNEDDPRDSEIARLTRKLKGQTVRAETAERRARKAEANLDSALKTQKLVQAIYEEFFMYGYLSAPDGDEGA